VHVQHGEHANYSHFMHTFLSGSSEKTKAEMAEGQTDVGHSRAIETDVGHSRAIELLRAEHDWPTPVPIEQLNAALKASDGNVDSASLWLFTNRPMWPMYHTPSSTAEVIERERARREMSHDESRDVQKKHERALRDARESLGLSAHPVVAELRYWNAASILEYCVEQGATPTQLAALERHNPAEFPSIVVELEAAVQLCNYLQEEKTSFKTASRGLRRVPSQHENLLSGASMPGIDTSPSSPGVVHSTLRHRNEMSAAIVAVLSHTEGQSLD
jgi:hypothetical protein